MKIMDDIASPWLKILNVVLLDERLVMEEIWSRWFPSITWTLVLRH